MKILIKLFFTISVVLLSINNILADEKLRADQIIQKHLDSIATKEKRATISNQLLMSNVQFIKKGAGTPLTGRAVFASEGDKNLWGMVLSSNDYPQDKFGFNGENTQVAFTKPGSYSILGDFIFNNKSILKEGMLGGVLFSSWSLNDIQKRQAKVSAAGTKKINGVETYVLEYSPKGSFDLEVKMFFDKTTFRHVRTEYSKVIAARQAASIDNSAGQSSDRFQITEDFSEFQNMDGLTLPSNYKLKYNYYNNSPIQVAGRQTVELEWKFIINAFSYNQSLEPNSFKIETN